MASHQQTPGGIGPVAGSPATSSGGGGYKRASRKGAAKIFICNWEGCEKRYSRHEHLQRHQLNHSPKQIFKCDVSDCNQMFVRQDLLIRHKKRHSTSYVPRNRASSFSINAKDSSSDGTSVSSPGVGANNGPSQPPPVPTLAPAPAPSASSARPATVPMSALPPLHTPFMPPASMPRNVSVLLSPNSTISPHRHHPHPHPPSHSHAHQSPTMNQTPTTWNQPIHGANMLPPKPGYFPQGQASMPDHSTFMPFPDLNVPDDLGDQTNFCYWLFEPGRFGSGDPTGSNLSFMGGGLESPFNNNIQYDYESLTSRSQVDQTPPRHPDMQDEQISNSRRLEIVRWINIVHRKQEKYDAKLNYLLQESGGDYPEIHLDLLNECLRQYWDIVSPRLPIVHQPTFSPTRCPMNLLLVMIALGAAQIHGQSPTGDHEECKGLANLIITSIRLEILSDDGASPPVELWVAQALLLVEFYEKMYSTRKLHERGHIYHSVTLNLLRRGSPLIGKAGLESPPDEQSGVDPGTDDRTWWIRWAETQAMHRVVFAAFMMDVIHAAMFGHAADIVPQEIRLPLPCDETQWSAPNHESVRTHEANFRMYGVKPVDFHDGLKRALHGQEVQTHSFGRMIIMCGLISVGWHLRYNENNENNMKWLESSQNSTDTRDKWNGMLLKAFDYWKTSFDNAIGSSDNENGMLQQAAANGLIQSAAVLYHLAHISFYVNIIDCQVFAGAKRLLGRKVSSRDQSNVNARMAGWVGKATTRHAMLHAFKLLHRILVDPRQKKMSSAGTTHPFGGSGNNMHLGISSQYSTRADPDPHRPWIMYYATLSIWSFAQALKNKGLIQSLPRKSSNSSMTPIRRDSLLNTAAPEYLSRFAGLTDLDAATSATLCDGLVELLDAVCSLASQSHSELLKEACSRLTNCKDIMFAGALP